LSSSSDTNQEAGIESMGVAELGSNMKSFLDMEASPFAFGLMLYWLLKTGCWLNLLRHLACKRLRVSMFLISGFRNPDNLMYKEEGIWKRLQE
jgi:hypothetical protein